MNEKLDLIQKDLEKLFDKVAIEYDTSPDIRFIFEQNGHTIRRNFAVKMYEKHILEGDLKQFVLGLSIDVMDTFLRKE